MIITVKHITPDHWPLVASIYQKGMATGMATFETEIPSWIIWNNTHLKICRYGAWSDHELLGWVALSPVSQRPVYRGVAEVSIYVDPQFARQGVGSKLFDQIILESEKAGLWTLQSGIFPENQASIALHKNKGFRIIGYREKIAQLHGRWHDNVLMERRTKTAKYIKN